MRTANLFPHALKYGPRPGRFLSQRVYYDREERDQDRSPRKLSCEEKLLAATLIQSIQDYKGVTRDALEECTECHENIHPDCFTAFKRGREPYVTRTNRKCTEWHTRQECARNWLFDDTVYVVQRKTPKNPNPRDDLSCGYSCAYACESFNIDISYLRRKLNDTACEAYWNDEARIKTYLEFFVGTRTGGTDDSETPGDGGLSDQADDAD